MSEHIELGYAQTSHASQGRTVDTALLLVDTPTDSRGVYTPMTRGRDTNHAYVVVEDNQTALDVLTQALTRDWIDIPALARKYQLDPHRVGQLEPGIWGMKARSTSWSGVSANVSQNARHDAERWNTPWVAACDRLAIQGTQSTTVPVEPANES